jgi:hypothetical protein
MLRMDRSPHRTRCTAARGRREPGQQADTWRGRAAKGVVDSLITVGGKIEGFPDEAIGPCYRLSSETGADPWLMGSDTLLEAERREEAPVHDDDKTLAPLADPRTDRQMSGISYSGEFRDRYQPRSCTAGQFWHNALV